MNTDFATLIAQLESTDTAAQTAAANELASRGHDSQIAIVSLVRTVGIPDEEVLEACTAALEEAGPPSPEQIEPLMSLTTDCSGDVAYWAVTLLGRARAAAAPAVPALVAVLESDVELPVRERAAWALGEIGPAAKNAVSALTVAANCDDARLSRLAKKALESIGV
ncbi:MAG: HEAT repeat domain-containing protein [Pirellulales bacterium]